MLKNISPDFARESIGSVQIQRIYAKCGSLAFGFVHHLHTNTLNMDLLPLKHAEKDTGFRAKISFVDGLRRMLEAF